MTVHRGDVVLLPFPFASGAGSKRRPAVIVQNDRNNARLTNTIVAAITSTTHRSNEPTQLLVDPATATGKTSGLKIPSVISCENLLTIEQQLIVRRLGYLDSSLMRQVDACLKVSLGVD